MAEQDGKKPRRRRKSSEVDDQLAELLAKRDSLDVDKAERERVEKDALRRYAEAGVQLTGIDTEVRHKVEALQRQIADVEDTARADRVAGERAQAEALAALNTAPVGRTAEELSNLFDLPIKRVRRMIRDGKTGSTAPSKADRARPPTASTSAEKPAPSATTEAVSSAPVESAEALPSS